MPTFTEDVLVNPGNIKAVGNDGWNSSGDKAHLRLGDDYNAIQANYDSVMHVIAPWGWQFREQRPGVDNMRLGLSKEGNMEIVGTLGVGTSTPGERLHVEGAAIIKAAKGDAGYPLVVKNASGKGALRLYREQTVSAGAGVAVVDFAANTSGMRSFGQLRCEAVGVNNGVENGRVIISPIWTGAFFDSMVVEGADVQVLGGLKTDKESGNALALKWQLFTGNLDNDAQTVFSTGITTIVGVAFSVFINTVPDGTEAWVAGSMGAFDEMYQVGYASNGPRAGDIIIDDVSTGFRGHAYRCIVYYT